MKKIKFSKWLVALGLGAMMMTGLKDPVATKAAYPGTWNWDGSGWTYTYHDNSGNTWDVSEGFRKIDGKAYAFKDGYLVTGGWVQLYNSDSYWVYAAEDGELATGWQTIGGSTYYFYSTGRMARDITIEKKYYVDENGVYQGEGQWKTDGSRWWYAYADPKRFVDYNSETDRFEYRNYPKNTNMVIDGFTYAFDEDGYMMTGWIHDIYENGDDDWYYADANGKLAAGWKQIGGVWYYFDRYSGVMYSDCEVDGYKLGADGTIIDTIPGWKKDATGWWYEFSDGTYAVGICKIGDDYYCFNQDGYMLSGWVDMNKINGYDSSNPDWYYYEADGQAIGRGWHTIDGVWYYFPYGNGELAANGIWDGYRFDENGVYTLVKDETTWTWKTDGSRWWYENTDGEYMSNTITYIHNTCYAFDAAGYMMTGWVADTQMDEWSYADWYYFESDGRGAEGWKQIDGDWYCFSYGHMYRDTYVDGYYLNSNGVWEENPGYAIK
ncbi:MAG: hypothetical protein PUA62_01640 [Lachnospiraceae bacterium]|nr:hypothetical protein [Lachnospiraceae bacterium]